MLRRGFKIGSQPGNLAWFETGVDGVSALAADDCVAVERYEVYAAKVKRIV